MTYVLKWRAPKTFMMTLNWKKTFGFHGLRNNNSALYGLNVEKNTPLVKSITKNQVPELFHLQFVWQE